MEMATKRCSNNRSTQRVDVPVVDGTFFDCLDLGQGNFRHPVTVAHYGGLAGVL